MDEPKKNIRVAILKVEADVNEKNGLTLNEGNNGYEKGKRIHFTIIVFK